MAGSNTDPDRSTKQGLAFAAPDGMSVGRGGECHSTELQCDERSRQVAPL